MDVTLVISLLQQIERRINERLDELFLQIINNGAGRNDEEIATEIRRRASRLMAITSFQSDLNDPVKEPLMAVPQNITDALKQIDDATNKVADVIAGLRDKIKTSMTQEDVTSVTTQLNAVEQHLRAIATDPNNPTPPAPQVMTNKGK